jgi:hypothetical protein
MPDDVEQRPDLVFWKILTDIANFVAGRTVVAMMRNSWLFLKAGWSIQFISVHQKADAIKRGVTIIAWPEASG